MIMPNTFHAKLCRGEPTIGTHFLFADPDIPELIGDTGVFDYAEFAAEYSVLDMRLLYHMARAGQCGNLPLMIKLDQEAQGFWAQAALGAGFKSVLFTDVRSPSDVDACHRCVRPDTPEQKGRMGIKLRRPALGGYELKDYLDDLDSIVIAIMIEKGVALDNLDTILRRASRKGIAMTQWGPADYSLSRGNLGLMGTPEILPDEARVIEKSIEYGIHPRIEIGSVEDAKRFIDMGVRHFCIGWDRHLYRAAIENLGAGMKKLLESV